MSECFQMCGELITNDYVIHTARDLPAGLHLYHKVTGSFTLSFLVTLQRVALLVDFNQVIWAFFSALQFQSEVFAFDFGRCSTQSQK